MMVTESTEAQKNGRLRAVVVDDSHFMRTVLSDVLSEAGIEVVATAADGREGVETVATHEPDVVTMDLEMPEMDGAEAVEEIMASTPTPVLILSAHAAEGAERTFEAIDRGAVDFFTKPSGEISVDIKQQRADLISKVESVAGATVATTDSSARRSTEAAGQHPQQYADDPTLVVGASTGGPSVVEELLAGLPAAADLRILIVQHMPTGFTARFADRLDDASEYDVREATDGERIGGGEALVAKGGSHLRVSAFGAGRLRVSLTDEPPVHNVRPAVDVTLESAAENVQGPLAAAILTGMGADGAAGVREVDDAGGTVVAQDESTSAVYGMPKRAVETGAVDDVRPQSELVHGVLDAITAEGIR